MDREHLERIRDLFRKAEHRIKYVESLQGRLNIPSINHLRYVSFHVLNYVLDGEAAELNEAEHHASRALFDTYEIEVLFFLDLFRRFQNDYSNHPITDVIPQYLEWQDQCTAARDFIAAHGQAPNREKYWQDFTPHSDVLSVIFRRLPHAREAMNKKIAYDAKREGRLHKVAIVGAVIAIAVAITAWAYPDALRDWLRKTPELPQHKQQAPASRR